MEAWEGPAILSLSKLFSQETRSSSHSFFHLFGLLVNIFEVHIQNKLTFLQMLQYFSQVTWFLLALTVSQPSLRKVQNQKC